MLFGLWYVLYHSMGGKQACSCFWYTRGGGGSWWESKTGDDRMGWEWGWEMATCQRKGMKTSRNHVPVCIGSALRDLYLWWPAWRELRGHECAERALPAVVFHPLKSHPAQRSAVCGAQVKRFAYKYTEVPTLNLTAFYCIRS